VSNLHDQISQGSLFVVEAIRILTSIQQALKDKNWAQAINQEMGTLEKK